MSKDPRAKRHLLGNRFRPATRKSISRYKGYETSIFKRVIKDGYDGPAFIVMGDGKITFRQACRDNWQFKSVRKKAGWFIKDERGIDVTNMSLDSIDSICTLIPEYGSQKQKKASDEDSIYSSIQDSVMYYD